MGVEDPNVHIVTYAMAMKVAIPVNVVRSHYLMPKTTNLSSKYVSDAHFKVINYIG